MSNVKHQKCPMRDMANAAKERLLKNEYSKQPPVPKTASIQQREIFIKLFEMKMEGISTDVENPITVFADQEKLAAMSHEERQRYIMQICADYISMRTAIDAIDVRKAE